jgi:hypothetical protein
VKPVVTFSREKARETDQCLMGHGHSSMEKIRGEIVEEAGKR